MEHRRRSMLFIFFTILIDSIGIGLIFPVMPSLIAEITGDTIEKSTTYSGWLMTSYALMQFLFSPILGGLSDAVGRRPVLLLSLLGLGIDYVFLSLSNSLLFLFAGRLIAGLCGASFTTGFAYIADITPPEKRAQSFGMVGAAFGLGFILGPFMGGYLSDLGTRAPFVAAAVFSLVNFLFGLFILPESLPKQNRRPFRFKTANPFSAFKYVFKRKDLSLVLTCMFMIYLGGQVMPSIWSFFTKFRFSWTDRQVGLSLAFVGLMVSLVQGGLIRVSQKLLGQLNSIFLGFAFYILGLFLFAFSGEEWMMYVYTAIYAIGGIAPPSIQAIISSRVEANEQGEIQGVITSITSLSAVISPLIMTNLFYGFTNENSFVKFPGAPFLAAAILMIIGFLFFMIDYCRKKSIR